VGVSTDVLSGVLRAVRLTGSVYFDFEPSAPWVAEAPPSREIAATVMPGAERVIEYHQIARGACWGQVVDQQPIRLNEGDFIVFPQGDAHILSSAPGMRATPDMSSFARPITPLPLVYEFDGGGPDRARIVCCFLGCDERPFNPLLAALPRVIHLSAAAHDAATGWLATLLNIAVRESGSARAGSENILARLSELMFVEALRRYLEALPPTQTGWPMQYLALWRMQLASRLRAEGGQVAAVPSNARR
jgi:Cupin